MRKFSGYLPKYCSLLVVYSALMCIELNAQCVLNATFDLRGQPAGSATSTSILRNQKCCGASNNDCVSFNVILDSRSIGLVFEIVSGAIPSGSLFYNINCGPDNTVGQSICLQGGQTYNLTFCKPGSNENVYKITAIADLSVADATIKAGCQSQLNAIIPNNGGTITWTAQTPGTLSWLSCTNCSNPTVSPPLNTSLTSATFDVTWTGTNFACSSPISSTKSVTVTVVPRPSINITPLNPKFCSNKILPINATASGGGTYTLRWFSGPNGSGSQIGLGSAFVPPATIGISNYSVVAEDASNPCNFTVSNFSVEISPAPVFDFPDLLMCIGDEKLINVSTLNTYSWSSLSGITTYLGGTYGISPPGNMSYTVTATNSFGCTETDKFGVVAFSCTTCPGATTACSVQSAPPYTKMEDYYAAGGKVNFPCTILSNGLTLLSETIDGTVCPKTITRKYRLEDICGNRDTCIQTVVVKDTVFPVFTTSPPVFAPISCNQPLPAQPDMAVSDNCPATVVKSIDPYTPSLCGYSVTYRWKATDLCGNMIETTSVLQVLPDKTAPVFLTFPPDLPVTCESIPGVVTPTVQDICDPAPTLTFTTAIDPGTCPGFYKIRRIWTVRDICGNTTTKTQTISVVDVTGPVFSNVPANITVSCANIPTPVNPLVSDNCTPVAAIQLVMAEAKSDITCTNSYTLTRTWTATDQCGNSTSASQIIQVRDLSAPKFINPPANITVSCENIPAVAVLTATDSCDSAPVITYTETRVNGSCPNSYTLNRTWRATDACSNFSTHTQVITVEDKTAPIFLSFPADAAAACNAIPAAGSPTYSDNCDPAPTISFAESSIAGTCPSNYSLKRTWTLRDQCGNSFSRVQTITVSDTTKPVFSQYPGNLVVSCDNIPAAPIITATDNCSSNLSVAYNQVISPSCVANYLITRTWTTTDLCGNQRTHTQVLTVTDNQGPQFLNAPKDTTVSCANIPTIPTIAVVDNCTTTPVLEFTETRTNGSCTFNYLLTRRWTAKDLCGNVSTHTQVITVRDNIAPVLTGVPADLSTSCQSIPVPATPSATDNCDTQPTIVLEVNQINGACPGTYQIIRKWTARDACGNETIKTQTISVSDQLAPQFVTSVSDQTVSCGSIPTAPVINIKDLCDPTPTLAFRVDSLPGSCPGNYMLVRTWTAKDWCNNSSSLVQKITVQDLTPPTLNNIPADQTFACNAIPVPAVVSALDICDPRPVIVFAQTGGGKCTGSLLTRTWVATDWCGNSVSRTQQIQIEDKTAPEITGVPADATVDCSNIPVKASPQVTDNCTLNPQLQFQESRSSGCSGSYTITRTWTALDSCGNTSSKVQVITVQDNKAPQWQNPPADIQVSCNNIPPVPTLVATDNCSSKLTTSYKETRINGSCPFSYDLERIWTATDSCGNIGTHKQIIRVRDTSPPSLSAAPANVTVTCNAIPAAANPTASDNCDPNPTVQLTETKTTGKCAQEFTLRRTWTAVDACGNRDSVFQIIQVVDNQAPVISKIPADTLVSCGMVPLALTPQLLDDCDPAPTSTLNENIQLGTCPGTYSVVRTWIAKDQCGNSSQKTQRIDVRDIVPPTLVNIPAAITVSCTSIPAAPNITATDNCDNDPDVTFSQTRSPGCSGSYTITRTWTAIDACGNKSTATQLITVEDRIPPIFNLLPSDSTISCTQVSLAPVLSASDNCQAVVPVTFSQTTLPGNCPGNYVIQRKWTATDSCGNTAAHSQSIQVVDASPPVFSNVPSDISISCGSIPPVANPTAKDNCDSNPVITFKENTLSGSCAQNFTLERIWTAKDLCGNTSIAKQLIRIADTIAPVLSALPPDITVLCNAVPAAFKPTLTDNCDPAPTLSFLETKIPGSCPGNYTLVRTWTGKDACGNIVSGKQTLTVKDTVAPVMTGIPASVLAICSAVPTPTAISVTDNCDPAPFASFTEVKVPGNCPGNSVLTRTWTASDACGNVSVANQTITIKDTIAPTFNNPPGDISVSCKNIPTATNLAVNDNCDPNPAISFSEAADTICKGNSTIIRTWTARDFCGNVKQHKQIITIVDNEPPQIFGIPGDQTLVCGQTPATVMVALLDNCDANPKLVFSQDSLPGSCPSNYRLIKKWRATDRCGNTVEKTQTITYSDKEAPTWSNLPTDLTLTCADSISKAQPIATDNCGSTLNVVFSENLVAPTCPQSYTLTRKWTATDACGNSSFVSQKIEVKDQTAPVIAGLPKDTTSSCSAVPVALQLTAKDQCDPAAKLIFSEEKIPGNCAGNFLLKRTWIATDACNNQNKFTQTVTIEDKIPPVLENPPADIQIRCKENLPAMISLKWTDNCSGTGSVAGLDISDGKTNPETITRTWQIKDQCGLSSSVSQKIVILPLQGTASNDGPACPGGTVLLSATGGNTYQWSGPGGFSSTGANPSISPFTAEKAGIYTVIIRETQGCSLSLKTEVQAKVIPVKPFPVSICKGTTYTLNGMNFSTSGTFPVVFKNAAANGCDSTVLLTVEVVDAARATKEVFICPGSSFKLNGKSFSTEGTFTETLVGASSGGCDSIVTLNLKVRNQIVFRIKEKICSGESYTLNGKAYNQTGVFSQLLTGAAIGGCDSLIELDLSVNLPSSRNLLTSICQGETFRVGQQSFSKEGTYVVVLKGANALGCDSTVNLDLKILKPGINAFSRTICAESFYPFFGSNYVVSGKYEQILTGKAANGCDSIVQLDLRVLPPISQTLNVEICDEDSYKLNNEVYFNSGTYVQVFPGKAANGCDSSLIINVNKLPIANSFRSLRLCYGQTFTANGVTYSKSGDYEQSFTTARGCDSTFFLNLTILEPSIVEVNANICQGETYLFGTTLLDKGGKYSLAKPGAASFGCDSVINLTLNYGSPSSAEKTATICFGDTLKIGPYNISEPGDFTLKLPKANAQKCDSTIQLRVTRLPESAQTTKAQICSGETYRFFGQTYDKAGIYKRRLFGAAKSGCDSILYLDLAVNQPVVKQIRTEICQGGKLDFFGQSLTQSGVYRKTFANGAATGCDSIVELNLSILPPSRDTLPVVLCRGETFTLQNQTFGTSGNFQVLLPGATSAGCDSIVLLKVDILPDPVQNLSASICSGDTLSVAGKQYHREGRYLDTLNNAATNGCDSVIELSLKFYPLAQKMLNLPLCAQKNLEINGQTIDQPGTYIQTLKRSSRLGCDSVLTIQVFKEIVDTPLVAVTLCADTAYSFAGQKFEKAGEYLVKVPALSKNGCDSLVLLSLKKTSPNRISTALNICAGDSLTFGNLKLKEKGTYTQIFQNSGGCDSIVTLNLEVLEVAKKSLDTLICLGDKYKNWGKIFSQAGTYEIPLRSALGCDSLVNLKLTVEPADTFFIQQNLCVGKTLDLNGQQFFNSGKYLQVLPAVTANGCDSIILIDLNFSEAIEESRRVQICPGESFTANGISYFKEGTFTQFFPKGSTTGCDSLLNIQVSVLPQPTGSLQKNLCKGDTLQIHGSRLTTSGQYTLQLPKSAKNGCDSLVQLELKELLPGKGRLDRTLCAGDTLQFAGKRFFNPGSFTVILDNLSSNGCDSLIQLDILGLENPERPIKAQICEGKTFKLDTAVFDQQGNYRYVLPNRAQNGCDSILNLELTFSPTPKKSIADTLCFGDSLSFYGQTAAKTGMYKAFVANTIGCDSLILLDLFLRPLPSDTLTRTYCPGEGINFEGKQYNKPGLYAQLYPGAAKSGCDSLLMLRVEEAPIADTTLQASICSGQRYALNGASFVQTGNYLQTLPDASRFGCDSLITLQLSVIDTSRQTLTFDLCREETLKINNENYTQPGVYTQFFERKAKSGCDSLLKIVVNPLEWGMRTVFDTLCEGDTTRFFNTIVTLTSTQTRRFKAASKNGCDSILTVHYFFKPKIRASLDTLLYENDTLSLNGERFNKPGTYTQFFPGKAKNGCDSVLTIRLAFNGEPCQDSLYAQNTLCYGDTATISLNRLFATNPGSGTWIAEIPPGSKASFNPGTGILKGAGLYPGTYAFALNPDPNKPCPRLWHFVKIIVHPAPIVNAGEDKVLNCNIREVELSGESCLGCAVEWRTISGTVLSTQSLKYKTTMPQAVIFQATDPVTKCIARDTTIVTQDVRAPLIDAGADQEFSCAERKLTLQAKATGTSNALAIQWNAISGRFLMGEQTLSPTVAQAGKYALFVLDTKNGCSSRDTITVLPDAEALTNVRVINAGPNCDFSVLGSIQVVKVEGGVQPFKYALNQDSLQDKSLFPNLAPGRYPLRIQDVLGCYLDTTIVIYPPNRDIKVSLGPDIHVFLGDTVTLLPVLNFPRDSLKTITWKAFENPLPCSTCWSPSFVPLKTGKYEVIVTNISDCAASDLITVYVDERARVYAPSAFSPNGDGNNDVFRLFTDGSVEEVELLQIFNRWGTLMYTAEKFRPNDPGIGWDGNYQGQLMDPAVFVFYAKIKLINGESKLIKGEVVLMR